MKKKGVITQQQLADILIQEGFIVPNAVEYPLDYDEGATVRRVAAVCKALNKLVSTRYHSIGGFTCLACDGKGVWDHGVCAACNGTGKAILTV